MSTPSAAIGGLTNRRLNSRETPPNRYVPGTNGVGEVLSKTSAVLFVSPTTIETALRRVSIKVSDVMPKAVKLTTINKSGVVIEDLAYTVSITGGRSESRADGEERCLNDRLCFSLLTGQVVTQPVWAEYSDDLNIWVSLDA